MAYFSECFYRLIVSDTGVIFLKFRRRVM